MKFNLVLRHTFDLGIGGGGFIRFLSFGRFNGPGLKWVPSSKPLTFSEREGRKRYLVSRGLRWSFIGPRMWRS